MENKKVKEGKKVQLWVVLLAILAAITVGITGIFVIKGMIDSNKPNIYTNLIKTDASKYSVSEVKQLAKVNKIAKTKTEYNKIVKDVFGISPDEYGYQMSKTEKFPVYDEQFFALNSLAIVYAERHGPNVVDNVECVSVKAGKLNIKFAPHSIKDNSAEAYVYIIEIPKKNIEGVDKIVLEYTSKSGGGFGNTLDKPILYLYPEKDTQISVKLTNKDSLINTYPIYDDGWNVLAKPNGDLIDLSSSKKYYSLYWDEKYVDKYDMSKGFCVKGEDTILFLEEYLEKIGLNYKEANEFIIYWLPKMQHNEYNWIYFELTEQRQKNNEIIIEPAPDSLLRVNMHFKPLDKYVETTKQDIPTFSRNGFSAVEWGGTQYTD